MRAKKLFIPPLVPVGFLLLLCAWTFFDEMFNGVAVIDGKPDNAPRWAAVIFMMLSALVYIGFFVLNLIDAYFDRLTVVGQWFGTSRFGLFFIMRFMHPKSIRSGLLMPFQVSGSR